MTTSITRRVRVRRWGGAVAGTVLAAAVLAAVGEPAQAAGGSVSDVARQLQKAIDGVGFEEVLDRGPEGSRLARSLVARDDGESMMPQQRARMFAGADPKPIVQQPQVDATIIELDKLGRPVASGTVLMGPKYRHGTTVPVDRNFHTSDVRWRQWDVDAWYANQGQGTVDVVPGRDGASKDFMSPYPASVLKLLVNFGILRLVDKGEIKLDETYNFQPGYKPDESHALCGEPTTKTIGEYIDASITYSSNAASCALIKVLHDHKAVDDLNKTFQDLGLETLQLKNTNPSTGGNWFPNVTMSSLDTAKLLAIVNGGLGVLWAAPNGKPVTGALLSVPSRQLFKDKLLQQGYNTVLSTTNWCGQQYPVQGIPQVTADRWIAADGSVVVHGEKYGPNVRPCNQAAEVTYSHKNGNTYNAGADAGIVESLLGKPGRSYIVVVFSNLGSRFTDRNRPPTPSDATEASFTEKFAKLGLAIDQYETKRFASNVSPVR